MKTQFTTFRIFKRFSFLSIFSLLFVSCGSYQNSTYYENDGIYASTERQRPTSTIVESNNSGSAYKSYFRTLRNDLDQEVGVDYNNPDVNDTINASNERYGGWGADNSTVVVNVYDNGWGMNNWGWNNWYGPGWGLGWNNWGWNNWGFGWGMGWGWNSWYGPGWGGWYGPGWGGGWYGNGFYNGWYGYNNGYGYVRNSGRRGSYANSGGRYSI